MTPDHEEGQQQGDRGRAAPTGHLLLGLLSGPAGPEQRALGRHRSQGSQGRGRLLGWGGVAGTEQELLKAKGPVSYALRL